MNPGTSGLHLTPDGAAFLAGFEGLVQWGLAIFVAFYALRFLRRLLGV